MLAEEIVNGIILGSLYALIAQGYTLVFGVLDKLNFAHSEIFMLGGFITLASVALGAPVWVALIVVFGVSGLLGLVVELVSFRKFRGRDAQITAALSSFAVGLVIIDLVQKYWGTEPVGLSLPAALRVLSIEILGMRIALVKLAILGISLLLTLGLQLLVAKTAIGRNIRATAESPSAAALLGINVKRTIQQTFFIASALAGVGGLTLVLRTGYASPDVGFSFGLKALAIMAIGGMGDLRGTFLGGLLVGVAEALAFTIGLGELGDTIVWLLMIVVLLVRPVGLFGATWSREMRA